MIFEEFENEIKALKPMNNLKSLYINLQSES